MGRWVVVPTTRGLNLARVGVRAFLCLPGPSPKLCVAAGIPAGGGRGRDFRRLWEGPGAGGWWAGAFHSRSDSTAREGESRPSHDGMELERAGGWVVVLTMEASTLRGWSNGLSGPAKGRARPGGDCVQRGQGKLVVPTDGRLIWWMDGKSSFGSYMLIWPCEAFFPDSRSHPGRVQACVRLPRAACGLAYGPARAACGPACGCARSILRPPPPSAPSVRLSRGWGNSVSGTKLRKSQHSKSVVVAKRHKIFSKEHQMWQQQGSRTQCATASSQTIDRQVERAYRLATRAAGQTRWRRWGVAINAASCLLKASTDGAFPGRCGLPPSGQRKRLRRAASRLGTGHWAGCRRHDHERVMSKAKVARPCLWPAMT